MNPLKILLKDSFWLLALGQGLRRFTLYKLLVMLIHWLIAHILKSKLGDHIITQNVLLISGVDYTFWIPLMSSLVMFVALAVKQTEVMKWAHTLIHPQPFFPASLAHSSPLLIPEVRSRCHDFVKRVRMKNTTNFNGQMQMGRSSECHLLVVCIWKSALISLRK